MRLASVLTDCPVCEKKIRRGKRARAAEHAAPAFLACPAGAISGKEYAIGMAREDFFDAECCSNFMKKSFQMIGRGAVCGVCMATCQKVWEEKIRKKTLKIKKLCIIDNAARDYSSVGQSATLTS